MASRLAGGTPEEVSAVDLALDNSGSADVAREPGTSVNINLTTMSVDAWFPLHGLRRVFWPNGVDFPDPEPHRHRFDEVIPYRMEVVIGKIFTSQLRVKS